MENQNLYDYMKITDPLSLTNYCINVIKENNINVDKMPNNIKEKYDL